MTTHSSENKRTVIPSLLALGLFAWTDMASAAPAKPSIGKIVANDVAHTLTVEGKAKMSVSIYDAVADQWLASQTPDSKGKFKFNLTNLPTMPCSVRVEADGVSSAPKAVKSLSCVKGDLPPVCKIKSPSADKVIAFKDSVSFLGEAKDPEGTRLQYEWDFGGGATARPTTLNATNIKFDVQNNTAYNVSFIVTDLDGRRCSDRIKVTVGVPPVVETTKVPEQPAKAGDSDYAILPFSPFGMEFHDGSHGLYSMVTPTHWISAQVLKKGSVGTEKPVLLSPEEAGIQFSAASNPQDPAGRDSINSTSQNFPVGSTYAEADVRKSDWYDPCMVWTNSNPNTDNASAVQYGRFFDVYLEQKPYAMRAPIVSPGTQRDRTNAECNFAAFFLPNWKGSLPYVDPNNPKSYAYTVLSGDEGAAFWSFDMFRDSNGVKFSEDAFDGFLGAMPANGSSMPGIDAPYVKNDPQEFSTTEITITEKNYPGFDASRKLFASVGLPITPTDDKGRHNPYPVMRLQAFEAGNKSKILATTDTVAGVTTEMRCAECHTKGRNGADQAVYDALRADVTNLQTLKTKTKLVNLVKMQKGMNPEDTISDVDLQAKANDLAKWIPKFLAPEDVDAARKDEVDVIEQAAMVNTARLHDFYYNFIKNSGWLGPLEFESGQIYGKQGKDAVAATETTPSEPAVAGEMHVEPGNCTDYCHKSVPRADPKRYNMAPLYDADAACPELSDSLHNIHGRLMTTSTGNFDAARAPIVRDAETRELKLANLTDKNELKKVLLGVKDAGTPDDSCFYCHAGKKDKFQRDVMTTAGVNCIDCHGDLAVLAGGGAMVSRDAGNNPLSSRDEISDEVRNAPIDLAKLASAFSAEQSSYGPEADGTYFYMEKGQDGKYRHNGNVVSTLDMVLEFQSEYKSIVDNGNGNYTLTKEIEGQPDQVTHMNEAELIAIVTEPVNLWNLQFARIPWVDELSCANCHTGEGDEAVRRRAYDMTTGKFRLNQIHNERFAENMLPKKHDSSFTLLIQDGQNCPPGTYSDTVEDGGRHVCVRGLFKDSVDRHGGVSCEACHGPTHAVWPNPDPYANDNVTAMQLQGHTGTILECNACHTQDAFKTEDSNGSSQHYPDAQGNPTILAGPHNTHPVNDPNWYLNERTGSNPRLNKVDGSKKGGWHSVWAGKPGLNAETDQCAVCHGKDHKGTRLSKTPVDRLLTTGKAMKYKKVTVKAGTPIGCDLCHSLEQSFTKDH